MQLGTTLRRSPRWRAPSCTPDALFGVWSLLLYVPALFVMEEVVFRGAVDSHVAGDRGQRRGGQPTIYGIASAVLVSVALRLLAPPDRAQRDRSSIAHRAGLGGTVTLAFLAQVGQPHGARVRPRLERFGAERLRPYPVRRGSLASIGRPLAVPESIARPPVRRLVVSVAVAGLARVG